MKDGGGHIVMLGTALRKTLDRGKQVSQKLSGRTVAVGVTNGLDALDTEVLTLFIEGIHEAVGKKYDGISGEKRKTNGVIGDRSTEQARRNTRAVQDLAALLGDVDGSGHSGTRNAQLARSRIEDGVLNGGMTLDGAAKSETAVQHCQYVPGSLAGLVNAAQRADRESTIHGGGQPFSGNVSDIQADGAIVELKIVQEIAANLGNGLEAMKNVYSAGVEGSSGKHHLLNHAGFLEILMAQFFKPFDSNELEQGSSSVQSFRGHMRTHGGPDGILKQGGDPGRGKTDVVSSTHTRKGNVAAEGAGSQNASMRALASILVAAALAVGMYMYYVKSLPTTDPGTAPTQAISLTGVRSDLLQIARAERSYIALDGHCGSMEEMISSSALTMTKPERDGYVYTVDCSGATFNGATARHAPAPEGSPIRYPTLAIDGNMDVHEVN